MALHHPARLAVIVCLLTCFVNLGGPRLWDRDEPRNAGCAREMLAANDWVVPVFNDQLRGHKPVLLYWAMMLAYQLPVDIEFAARLPSALFGLGTVLTTYAFATHLFGASIGRLAGAVLASSLMFVVSSRAATPDAPLIFFCSLSIYLFARGIIPAKGEPLDDCDAYLPRPYALGMYAAMGLGLLAKGPIGVVLPMGIIATFLIVDRRTQAMSTAAGRPIHVLSTVRSLLAPGHLFATARRLRPLLGMVVIASVAVPWYVWVGVRTDGAWLREFFFEHNVGRALRPMEGHDGGAFYYYPLAILCGFFPWSVFTVPALLFYYRARTTRERASRRD